MHWETERKGIMDLIRLGGFVFDELALRLYEAQYAFNPVYRAYLDLLYGSAPAVNTCEEIPCLPIEFFKTKEVRTGSYNPSLVFESSATTGQQRSRHFLREPGWYHEMASVCFSHIFGQQPGQFRHLAVLPSYAENQASSLLYMLDQFMKRGQGGYYHSDPAGLSVELEKTIKEPTILWGVSYALYNWPMRLQLSGDTLVMETGGMKGREKEMTRQELHQKIMENFGVTSVCSEYGMTELMSQAYALSEGLFVPGPCMRVVPRQINDPLSREQPGQQAALNIIDLANVDSCAFIATDDLGRVYGDGRFEVLGRLDRSDIRGCNLLLA
ncbi:MAG TPA: acyl transferase [Saprospiraceae bacterium]|nr:acyl transferase [Saprospiraceae bacterium]HNT21125.1 acyl transferase [Saprospiraceae bacterium]